MRIHRTFALAVAAVVALALTGCFSLKKDYPEKRLFMLDARRPQVLPAPSDGDVLLVHKFTISQAFERLEFVYRLGEHGYESDFYNAFFAPPQEMVAEQCAQWLGNAALYSQATRNATRLDVRYLLEGHIVTLYGDLRDPEKPRAVLEIAFTLVDEKGKDGPAGVLHKTYREAIDISDASSRELADGWSRALAAILKRLEADLRTAQNR